MPQQKIQVMEHFLEIYGTLPRAGPGSNELTRKAFRSLGHVGNSPKILDVGCGPGMQTIELLQLTNGSVVALDLLSQMIDRVQAAAEAAGVANRLTTNQQDMKEMEFPHSSFDIVWSEGAIYLLGFETGLRTFWELVKPNGYVVVSDVVWLTTNPTSEAVEFWSDYPDIDTIDAKINVVKRAGFDLLDHFVFPPSAWTDQYYTPMERRIAEMRPVWRGIPEGEAVLEEATNEISVFRRCSAHYSYAFFVMQKPVGEP